MWLTQTRRIIIWCVCLLVGLFLSQYGADQEIFILIGIIAVAAVFVHERLRPICIGMVFLSVGLVRGASQYTKYEFLRSYADTKAQFQVVAREDAEYGDRSQLTFSADRVIDLDSGLALPGQILVAGFGEVSVQRGDVVQVSGKPFASKGAHQLRMSFADMEVVGRDSSWVDGVRRRFAAGVRSMLPEPHASLGLGFLIGERSTLPESLIVTLRVVGLSHIIAVSGYNLTIMIRFVLRILKKASRFQKLFLSCASIAFFLAITGLSPSIVRASVVTIIGLLCWYWGLNIKPGVLLAISAVVTGVYKPLYVWGDAGWILSFLAFFGVLIISPTLQAMSSKGLFEKTIPRLVLETLSVLVMTLPYSLYTFGVFPVYALPANIVVVPFVPLAMAGTFMTGLIGQYAQFLSLVTIPVKTLFRYILDISQLFADLPGASRQIKISIHVMVMLYVVICVLVWWARRRPIQKTAAEILF
jgi:competence protein ComEC